MTFTTSKSLSLLSAGIIGIFATLQGARAEGERIVPIGEKTCSSYSCDPEPPTDDNTGEYTTGNGWDAGEVSEWLFCCSGADSVQRTGALLEVPTSSGGGGGGHGLWERISINLGRALISSPGDFVEAMSASKSTLSSSSFARTNITRKAELQVIAIGDALNQAGPAGALAGATDSIGGSFTPGYRPLMVQLKFEGGAESLGTIYGLAYVATPSTRVTFGPVNSVNAFARRQLAKGSTLAFKDGHGNLHSFVSASSAAGAASYQEDSLAVVTKISLRQFNHVQVTEIGGQ
jgi:hypothetical protein